jgi:hypothetical protein
MLIRGHDATRLKRGKIVSASFEGVVREYNVTQHRPMDRDPGDPVAYQSDCWDIDVHLKIVNVPFLPAHLSRIVSASVTRWTVEGRERKP